MSAFILTMAVVLAVLVPIALLADRYGQHEARRRRAEVRRRAERRRRGSKPH